MRYRSRSRSSRIAFGVIRLSGSQFIRSR